MMMRIPGNRKGLFLFLLLFVPSALQSHPHIFIDNRITIVFDENGLAGFRLNWVFDKVFSAAIIHDFDRNGDQSFSRGEIEAVKDGAFSNLKNFHYFCDIAIDGSIFQVQYVTDFVAAVKQSRIIYNFFVPCHVRATPGYKKVTIAVYDGTYFTEITYEDQNPVVIENLDPFECNCELVENEQKAYWGGQMIPIEARFRFRKRQ